MGILITQRNPSIRSPTAITPMNKPTPDLKSRRKATTAKSILIIPFQYGNTPYLCKSFEEKNSTMLANKARSEGSHVQNGEYGSLIPKNCKPPGVRKIIRALALYKAANRTRFFANCKLIILPFLNLNKRDLLKYKFVSVALLIQKKESLILFYEVIIK